MDQKGRHWVTHCRPLCPIVTLAHLNLAPLSWSLFAVLCMGFLGVGWGHGVRLGLLRAFPQNGVDGEASKTTPPAPGPRKPFGPTAAVSHGLRGGGDMHSAPSPFHRHPAGTATLHLLSFCAENLRVQLLPVEAGLCGRRGAVLGRPPPPPPLLDAGVAGEGHLPKGFAETLPGGPAENHRKSVAWGAVGVASGASGKALRVGAAPVCSSGSQNCS